jgi:hypothetical protein
LISHFNHLLTGNGFHQIVYIAETVKISLYGHMKIVEIESLDKLDPPTNKSITLRVDDETHRHLEALKALKGKRKVARWLRLVIREVSEAQSRRLSAVS